MNIFKRIFKSKSKSKEKKQSSMLENSNSWKVKSPGYNSDFFKALINLIPDNSLLYIEDIYEKEVKNFLKEISIETNFKIKRGSLWPKPEIFHIPATKNNLEKLAQLAEKYSISVHFHIYNNDKIILEWYDAFEKDSLYISKEIPEQKIKEFCKQLNIEYYENKD